MTDLAGLNSNPIFRSEMRNDDHFTNQWRKKVLDYHFQKYKIYFSVVYYNLKQLTCNFAFLTLQEILYQLI